MPQLFHPSANVLARVTIWGGVLLLATAGWAAYQLQESPYFTHQGIVRPQPVAFSHEHHVKGLGVDCRYCHTSVEDSAFAGLPPTETCMTCHSKVWTNAPILEPVRVSWQTNQPIRGVTGLGWTRVHNLPGFVYFNHSIHVNKGVGCSTCHGKVDEMPLMWQAATLQMQWCLDCHRKPEEILRERDKVFDMTWAPPSDQAERGKKLAELYHVAKPEHLTTCYVCHR